MVAHAHGAEEEEVIEVRTDGAPSYQVSATAGSGFPVDYERFCKFLGGQRITYAEFERDMEEINSVYLPLVARSGKFLKYGVYSMLASCGLLIFIGVIGVGTGSAAVMYTLAVIFFVGLAMFLYSKWIEQPAIHEGAALVRQHIEETINPRYEDHPYRVVYSVRVLIQAMKASTWGRRFADRPILEIFTLRSPDANGKMNDWPTPPILNSPLFVDTIIKDEELL